MERRMKKVFLICSIFLAACSSQMTEPKEDNNTNPPPGSQKPTSITQYGITWTFSTKVQTGQFVTGDYYVVGPCTITSITPVPGNGRNGSEFNPPLNDSKSGYDSREEGNRYNSQQRCPLKLSILQILC
jgi:hypothetical protein